MVCVLILLQFILVDRVEIPTSGTKSLNRLPLQGCRGLVLLVCVRLVDQHCISASYLRRPAETLGMRWLAGIQSLALGVRNRALLKVLLLVLMVPLLLSIATDLVRLLLW